MNSLSAAHEKADAFNLVPSVEMLEKLHAVCRDVPRATVESHEELSQAKVSGVAQS